MQMEGINDLPQSVEVVNLFQIGRQLGILSFEYYFIDSGIEDDIPVRANNAKSERRFVVIEG